jgi:hypothetical protein
MKLVMEIPGHQACYKPRLDIKERLKEIDLQL